jgi:hypothetical protein
MPYEHLNKRIAIVVAVILETVIVFRGWQALRLCHIPRVPQTLRQSPRIQHKTCIPRMTR